MWTGKRSTLSITINTKDVGVGLDLLKLPAYLGFSSKCYVCFNLLEIWNILSLRTMLSFMYIVTEMCFLYLCINLLHANKSDL